MSTRSNPNHRCKINRTDLEARRFGHASKIGDGQGGVGERAAITETDESSRLKAVEK